MSGDWDDSLKTLLNENLQDFVSWLFTGALVTGNLLTEFKKRTINADALVEAMLNGKPFLVHFEIQSTNDPTIAERLLEYNFEAKRIHKLPVYSCVIYLRSDGDVPKPPLIWEIPDGQEVLRFHYRSIELGELSTQDLRRTGRVGLLPLLILTKDGARREVVEEVILELEEAKQYNLLPVTELLASLVFYSQVDQDWLKGRFAMLDEVLRNTPAYQRILKEGRAEGLEEGLEKGLQKGLEKGLEKGLQKGLEKGREEAYKQELLQQREALLDIMRERFPKMVRQVKPLVYSIDNTALLLRLIIKLTTVPTAEEAQQLILDASEEEEQD